MPELEENLIKQLAICRNDGFTPQLKTAIMKLVNQGVDFTIGDEKKNTLLFYLVLYNINQVHNKEIFALLKLKPELAKKINTQHGSFLQQQIKFNPNITVAEVQQWIDLGSPLNSTTGSGETLLHTSAATGNLKLIHYLISQQLTLTAKTKFNETLLHSATTCQNLDVWNFLKEQSISINAQDQLKNTPLHCAIRAGNAPMVNWLLQNEADLELRDIEGNIPLMLAEKVYSSEQNNQQKKDIVAILRNAQHEKSKKRLLDAIGAMDSYGRQLSNQGFSKANTVIFLATTLRVKVENYDFQSEFIKMDLMSFKKELYYLLNSQNAKMSQYRINWITIIKNIAIAISGIGALALIGQLMYSKATKGRSLFFFQKEKTTSEEKVAATVKALDFYC